MMSKSPLATALVKLSVMDGKGTGRSTEGREVEGKFDRVFLPTAP